MSYIYIYTLFHATDAQHQSRTRASTIRGKFYLILFQKASAADSGLHIYYIDSFWRGFDSSIWSLTRGIIVTTRKMLDGTLQLLLLSWLGSFNGPQLTLPAEHGRWSPPTQPSFPQIHLLFFYFLFIYFFKGNKIINKARMH